MICKSCGRANEQGAKFCKSVRCKIKLQKVVNT